MQVSRKFSLAVFAKTSIIINHSSGSQQLGRSFPGMYFNCQFLLRNTRYASLACPELAVALSMAEGAVEGRCEISSVVYYYVRLKDSTGYGREKRTSINKRHGI